MKKTDRSIRGFLISVAVFLLTCTGVVGKSNDLLVLKSPGIVYPFDEIIVASPVKGNIEIADGRGQVYTTGKIDGTFRFRAGGALGTHIISLIDRRGRVWLPQPLLSTPKHELMMVEKWPNFLPFCAMDCSILEVDRAMKRLPGRGTILNSTFPGLSIITTYPMACSIS